MANEYRTNVLQMRVSYLAVCGIAIINIADSCGWSCRDEFIRYRIAVCDAKSKFCDAKLNVIRRKLRCKAILTAQK